MRFRRALVLGLLTLVAVAGCGGNDDGDGVATAGGQASASASAGAKAGTGPENERENALKFSQCVRENGVPNFPDPELKENGDISLSLPEGADPAKVKAAEEKCKQYQPNGGEPRKADPQVLEQLRQYSKCMRENGVLHFPDPTDQGLQIDNNVVNPEDPKVKAAERACNKHIPPPPPGSLNRSDG
ncbi:hypothetical protein GCM10027280_10350 [Micromonospora polyrhachis]|uniref:Uncharacterized protein n=1 Tax=Micromonospora polyrhachis TaxID=1282883 RepID=A0A7W7SNQ0_9ACTN|nr:hypothetical protein [Micromonospora polyrhachis]MBB4958108.1 hypothetical protein [Micromonospora polyrhachis]